MVPPSSESPAPAARPVRGQTAMTAIVLAAIVCSIFLFARLGHYALWDDESLATLVAQNTWRTGDTNAYDGRNIVAYRGGITLNGFKDRSSPPLQHYVIAPFVGLLGPTSFAARLPMAISGLLCIALLLYWIWRDAPDDGFILLFCLALVANVSLFLYFRQARYYGLTILLTTAVAFVYAHLRRRRDVVLLAGVLLALLSANYLSFAATVAMLAADYLIWGRKRYRFGLPEWAIVILPQLLLGSVIIWIWNPTSITVPSEGISWFADRSVLLWWNIRDLFACEFGATALLVAAPLLAWRFRNAALARLITALAVGVFVTAVLSPESSTKSDVADVRYLCGLIPFCIAAGAMALHALTGRQVWSIGVPAACVLFGSNLLQGNIPGRGSMETHLRSTVLLYAEELSDPPPEPYTSAAEWINAHVRDGQSILVYPTFMMYPLMYHAPRAVYAWQLSADAPAVYRSKLAPIQFDHGAWPDYVIMFDPGVAQPDDVQLDPAAHYRLVAMLDTYGQALFRPELFWRIFRPLPPIDPRQNGICIYERVERVDH